MRTPRRVKTTRAKTVWYALGGGAGHGRRALSLASRLPGRHHVLHQGRRWASTDRVHMEWVGTPTLERFSLDLERACLGADRLVVDSFPAGIAHELVLPAALQTVLVARYVDRSAYPDYDAAAARFDTVWLPYHPDDCEWERAPPGEFIGPVIRPIHLSGRVDTLVIGQGEPPGWSDLLAGATRVTGPFDTLPRATRVLALAAGYNLAWELASLGLPTAYRPLHRRFDDQFRRAAHRGRLIHHRRDLQHFLEAAC